MADVTAGAVGMEGVSVHHSLKGKVQREGPLCNGTCLFLAPSPSQERREHFVVLRGLQWLNFTQEGKARGHGGASKIRMPGWLGFQKESDLREDCAEKQRQSAVPSTITQPHSAQDFSAKLHPGHCKSWWVAALMETI